MDVGTLLVRHDPRSVGEVRHRIAADLRGGPFTGDSVDDVLLVASEMVGNAVVHSDDGDLDVGWQVDFDTVTVRVTDRSDQHPHLKHAGTDAPNGRGMAIIAAIAREWGVRPHPQGKQVWACVPMQRI